MRPVGKDLRKLMFKLKKIQGTDIARSFDGLNDTRNLELSIDYAKEGGMIAQTALSITHSKIHNVDYYIKMANTLIDRGAEEICIKDMAGVGRPASLGRIVAGIRKNHPDIPIQYHGHSGPGFSVASTLEVVRAGADIVDVAVEPLSWGTVHPDLLTIHAMLRDAGYSVPDINMNAYMEVRTLTQKFIDEFLGEYINPRNRLMNSLLIGPGLPGGMMGSLMADLENNLKSLNKWMDKNGKPSISQDELLIKLFDEVEYIWPILGYPPLVTPFSQYVKNVALMNVTQMLKGKDRWSMIDDNTWDMLLGKSGRLPGKIGEEIISLAESQGREFFEGDPQDLYPDELDKARAEMKENGWETGADDEELFEFAMHPEQYKAYKSGAAKKSFDADLAERKKPKEPKEELVATPVSTLAPSEMNIDVNGEKFAVKISYDQSTMVANQAAVSEAAPAEGVSSNGTAEILAPIEGNFMLTKNSSETAVKVGDKIQEGDLIGYIEAMKVYNAIHADKGGTLSSLQYILSDHVDEDDLLIKLS